MSTKKSGSGLMRVVFAVFVFVFIISFFVSHVYGAQVYDGQAYENGAPSLPSEYFSLVDSLPDEVVENLPPSIYSEDVTEVADAVAKMSSVEFFSELIASLVGAGMSDALSLFVSLSGILVFGAVLSALKSSINLDAFSRASSFIMSCALFYAIIRTLSEQLSRLSDFFERLSTLILGIIPMTGVIYAMGGNVTTAVTTSSTMYVFLAFCENFCASSVTSVAVLCVFFSLCGSVSVGFSLKGMASATKKCYTFVLGLIMTVLLSVLSTQTVLSASADSVSARAMRLVASNVIPIVGGSIGETLRTLSSSVSYIKSVCGIGAIFFLIILILPMLITLLLTRFVYILSVAVADMLGCDSESRLLSDIGSVYGMLIAVVSMCSVMTILALTLFLRCTVAAA